MIWVVFNYFSGKPLAGCAYELLMIRKVTLRITCSLTKPVHLNVKAFFEAARLALISSLFVNNAVAVSLAGVNHVPSHAPHEKTTAPVARIHAIVPSRRYISADFTENFGLSFNCF